jgi:hypothetical protein
MALSMRGSLQSFSDLGMRRAKMLESCPRPHPSPGRMRLETSRADVCLSTGTKVNPIDSSTQERKSACATARLIPIPHFRSRGAPGARLPAMNPVNDVAHVANPVPPRGRRDQIRNEPGLE